MAETRMPDSTYLKPNSHQSKAKQEKPQVEKVVIADPLYRPIVPGSARFVPLPHEGFSGRIWRRDIPDLAADLTQFIDSNGLAR